jgi:hypothetical protein
MSTESLPKKIEAQSASALWSYGEAKEKPPIIETAEQALVEINEEMGEFLGELDTAEKNAENFPGEEGEKLRTQLGSLRKEAKYTADWWAGNIYVFTELVVGDGINFPATEKIKEENKQETPEEMRERAKKELAENGITSEQIQTYKPGISETLRRGINPIGYDFVEKIIEFIPNLIIGNDISENHFFTDETYDNRQDAWRLYLGLPQKNNTFEISDYCPQGELGLEQFSSNEYCYKISNFWELFSEGEESDIIPILIKNIEQEEVKGKVYTSPDNFAGIMGMYSLHLGEDEKGSYVAYSDIWDLAVFPENEKGFFGKPFHIYDRLYSDSETYEPIFE